MNRYVLPLLLLVAIASRAQQLPPPPPHATADITAGELRHHLSWLASDALEGRGTGTRGNTAAAEYIAREFERYGLAGTGASQVPYLQSFPVVTGVELDAGNALRAEAGGMTTTFSTDDFRPYAYSDNGSASGTVVFAGYGIAAPQSGHDDYAGLSIRGRIALVLGGAPAGDAHADLGMFSSARSKAMTAREQGAAAILIVQPDADTLVPLEYDNAPSGSGIMLVSLRKSAADRMLRSAGVSVDTLAARAAAGMSHASLDLRTRMDLTTAVRRITKQTSNVVGFLEGTDPQRRDTVFVVGAHYDHLGWGQDGSMYRGTEPQIHNGADDNASGTAGLLELAQYFASHRTAHSLVFIAFAAEEMGVLGSSYWVSNPTRPLTDVAAMFNLDMIGRLSDSSRALTVNGSGTSPIWNRILAEADADSTFSLTLSPDGHGGSDQTPFYMKNIPVLFFFTGLHTDYHRPTDDADKINYAGEARVVRYVKDVITATDARPERPAFVRVKSTEERPRGYGVYVGTIPDFGAAVEGFKISGTSPGSPAEKAGLIAGDIITRFGETGIKNIYDYMNALSLHKPGEDVTVVVQRGEDTVTVVVKLVKK